MNMLEQLARDMRASALVHRERGRFNRAKELEGFAYAVETCVAVDAATLPHSPPCVALRAVLACPGIDTTDQSTGETFRAGVLAALESSAMPPFADGDVIGIDTDGCEIVWNAETQRGENSGDKATSGGDA